MYPNTPSQLAQNRSTSWILPWFIKASNAFTDCLTIEHTRSSKRTWESFKAKRSLRFLKDSASAVPSWSENAKLLLVNVINGAFASTSSEVNYHTNASDTAWSLQIPTTLSKVTLSPAFFCVGDLARRLYLLHTRVYLTKTDRKVSTSWWKLVFNIHNVSEGARYRQLSIEKLTTVPFWHIDEPRTDGPDILCYFASFSNSNARLSI